MATGNGYILGAVQVGNNVIPGVSNRTLNSGIQRQTVQADGAVAPRASYISNISPNMSFSTYNFDLLASIGIMGRAISDTTGGAAIYVNQLEPNASVYAGTNHTKYYIASGILYAQNLQVATDGSADTQFILNTASKPQVYPLVETKNVALPALPEIALFGMGPSFINGLKAETKSQLSIDFGLNVQPFKPDGDVYPWWHYILGSQPVTTITFYDASLVDDLGITGAIDTQATAIFLRKRVDGGEYYPNNEPVHVKITFQGDTNFMQLAGGSDNNLSTTTYQINHLIKDGNTTIPMTFTKDVIIPDTM